jgi:hypothetical protein
VDLSGGKSIPVKHRRVARSLQGPMDFVLVKGKARCETCILKDRDCHAVATGTSQACKECIAKKTRCSFVSPAVNIYLILNSVSD